MNYIVRFLILFMFISMAVFPLSIGCRRGPEVYRVAGVVTLDGNPYQGVTVTFYPTDGGSMGFAGTDDNGRYNISTFGAKADAGTMLGKYDVSFSKVVLDGPQPTAEELADPNFDPSKKYNTERTRELVPKRYVSPATSGFSVVVEKGKNEFNFDLKSK